MGFMVQLGCSKMKNSFQIDGSILSTVLLTTIVKFYLISIGFGVSIEQTSKLN
jgi:Mg/Co/Ni transporter MgtE